MDIKLWESLESVDETINKLDSIRDVLTIHSLPTEEVIQLLQSVIDTFSENQNKVWEEVRSLNIKYDDLKYEKDSLQSKYDKLLRKHSELQVDYIDKSLLIDNGDC